MNEAINRAGGFLPTAEDSRIILTRDDRSWTLDFLEIQRNGNRLGQILLKEGDTLYVPNNQEDPIYVLGEIAKPGTLPIIHGQISLAQALALSGGVLGASADARSIYVLRQGSAPKSVDLYHLDARNPTSLVIADRFRLNARDIIYVDGGPLVRWSRVMGLIMPTFSALTQGAYELNYIKHN